MIFCYAGTDRYWKWKRAGGRLLHHLHNNELICNCLTCSQSTFASSSLLVVSAASSCSTDLPFANYVFADTSTACHACWLGAGGEAPSDGVARRNRYRIVITHIHTQTDWTATGDPAVEAFWVTFHGASHWRRMTDHCMALLLQSLAISYG